MKVRTDCTQQLPPTFGDQVKWLSKHYRHSMMPLLADRYAVRSYIADKVGKRYLVPLVGVYNSPDEIDFDKLPNQFVLKCNHGVDDSIVCRNKWRFKRKKAKQQIQTWLAQDCSKELGKWWSEGVERKILCEELLQNPGDTPIHEHRLFMINGAPKFIQITVCRDHAPGTTHTFFELYGEQIPLRQKGFSNETEVDISRASAWVLWDEMVEVATQLVPQELPFVRLDFQVADGNVYVGDFTFLPSEGSFDYDPEDYGKTFGKILDLPE